MAAFTITRGTFFRLSMCFSHMKQHANSGIVKPRKQSSFCITINGVLTLGEVF